MNDTELQGKTLFALNALECRADANKTDSLSGFTHTAKFTNTKAFGLIGQETALHSVYFWTKDNVKVMKDWNRRSRRNVDSQTR